MSQKVDEEASTDYTIECVLLTSSLSGFLGRKPKYRVLCLFHYFDMFFRERIQPHLEIILNVIILSIVQL